MNPYQNRAAAGRVLAEALAIYQRQPKTMVLALPRGGVPVAYEIALTLHLPLDIFLVRKLGVPGHEELAMGALAEGNICILNNALIKQLHIRHAQIQHVMQQEKQELQRRLQCYRQARALPSLHDYTLILVDDGMPPAPP